MRKLITLESNTVSTEQDANGQVLALVKKGADLRYRYALHPLSVKIVDNLAGALINAYRSHLKHLHRP